ncbi:ABC transporter permease [Lachnospiraceae bacterium MD1]|uniref:ABC transporter permease n=1 Tax=Variimorphobacter saccharofermentans TaxID=2755051 RepID=A0A839K610_9FIRM|nr:ABC transporter permease [Variimorphobacter saccharofermentans]MBB2184101.1 ABC transporter permease [Variimorphobacter saccharofermentans]
MSKIDKKQFEWVGANATESESISRPSTSYWKDAMYRLSKNKVAVLSLIIIGVITLCSIIIPMLSPYTMSEQHLAHTYAPMGYKDAVDGHMHLFGTDTLGRDIFTRIWYGARISLFISFTAVFVNFIIGIIYGGISGYMGGAVDNIMMRIIEIINGIPYLIVVILLMMVLPKGTMTLVAAYAAVGWTGMARLVRGQIMSLKQQDFVVAAKVMGAKPARIIAKHLLPNTLSVVIVNITLAIPSAIFTEAFLSYIGLGVPVPLASWGTLANDGSRVFQMYPSQLIIPAICISITMLSFNLLGDGLRDALDPKLRR